MPRYQWRGIFLPNNKAVDIKKLRKTDLDQPSPSANSNTLL
jgi:hypothetical protein